MLNHARSFHFTAMVNYFSAFGLTGTIKRFPNKSQLSEFELTFPRGENATGCWRQTGWKFSHELSAVRFACFSISNDSGEMELNGENLVSICRVANSLSYLLSSIVRIDKIRA